MRRAAHQGLQLAPVEILTSRDGLAYTRQAVTQADVACLTAGVAELSEAAIFPGDDELWRRRWKLGSGHSLKELFRPARAGGGEPRGAGSRQRRACCGSSP